MTIDYAKKKLNYKPEGRRNIASPETRWEDDFREEGTGFIVDDDYCLARLIDYEETWKYTHGSGWC